jgi:hypothetical protein
VIGLDAQVAGSPDGTDSPPVLVGVLASWGVEIPLGPSPLFVRAAVEVGNLGPFFSVRGLVSLGVAVGG